MIQEILSTYYTPEIYHLFVAMFLGLCLGFERAVRNKDASFRTFALISAGSCLFTTLSLLAAGDVQPGLQLDASRIAAQIVSGVGFVCGGVIWANGNSLSGITTGAMIWFSAALGMCCGFGEIYLALHAFMCYFTILVVGEFLHKVVNKK
jgi:putative Mg2+ transporter-C (MgtC) family protein